DAAGRRYEGGGTYRFWIAKRMTLATATFQGQPYPVGASYGRDIQFNPAVPADVTVTADLYPNSDATNVRTLTYAGKASAAGLFGAAQGMKAFPLNAPGEYHAKILATYTDADGHVWVSTMRHAGVVYPEASPVIARGKKIAIGGKYVDRGETHFEGHVHENGDQHLAHITFPYLAGDMILIGSEGQGANKIEPVLTYQMAGDTSPWNTRLNGVGTTNLVIKTSNNYSPHLYPEYITDFEYYYGAAPRPGFMGRFLVGDSNVRAPYWAVSPNSFGGQIGASPNGDVPGDIYRLLGGVVLRRAGAAPMYSGYIASAVLLPKGTNNTRISAPGSEDLIGATGERARLFLVGLRPGTAFEAGSSFRPALQIDPLVPAAITFTLHYPDGRTQTTVGTGDSFGSFAGPSAWPLDVPGVYRYQVHGTWNGHTGRMPGLPDSGGYFFVYSKSKPAGVTGLRIDGSAHRTFSATAGATISGRTGGSRVYFTLLTPGAVIDQGELAVTGGTFEYRFDPVAVHAKAPIYDIVSITTGKPLIGRVIHLTFFADEPAPDGSRFFDVARVILRGTTLLAARGFVPPSAVTLAEPAGSVGNAAMADARDTLSLSRGVNRVAPADNGQLRLWDARVDRLVRQGDLVLTGRTADTIVAGTFHERLQQVHENIPVVGGEIVRQTRDGTTVSLFGSVHLGIETATSPVIEAEAARITAQRQTGHERARASTPQLVIVPPDSEAGPYALAWRTEVRNAPDVRLVDVDAITGAVLRSEPARRAEPRAHTLLDAANRFFVAQFGHRVIDESDAASPAAVKPAWAAAFDLAVREWTHRLLGHTAAFAYRGESGALAEAFADIMATAAEYAVQPGGNGPGQADYLIGEDAVAGGLRSLSDPARDGYRNHYGARDTEPGSATSMLLDSTIASFVYYLAVEGGVHPVSGMAVEGVGRAHRSRLEQVLFRAWVYMLPAGARFTDARAATLQSARDVLGPASPLERSLTQAWDAVGVR
ncbi:MAG: M4 family metallopeptidase, partial [Vicinamibacterales bacterium]|nr:M4 family metallopeptidase [Vicinamibacterales bacterium]